MTKYKCKNCGSGKLAYQYYVSCLMPVEYDDRGHYTYSEPLYDKDPSPDSPQGYCCQDCGQMVEQHGVYIKTEKDLLYSEEIDPEEYFSYLFPGKKGKLKKMSNI